MSGGCGVEESVCEDDEVLPFGTWLAPRCRLCLGDGLFVLVFFCGGGLRGFWPSCDFVVV